MAGERRAAGGARPDRWSGLRAGSSRSRSGGPAGILAGVLAGIELGEWDRRVAGWLAGLDTATALTVVSWVARAREAGPRR